MLKTLKYHKFLIKHLLFSINCDKWGSNDENIFKDIKIFLFNQ